MFAVGLRQDKPSVTGFDIPEPAMTADNQALVKIIETTLNGTDRSIIKYNLFDPPPGEAYMVLGHEAVGRVEAVGPAVKNLRVGDLVVPTVRRGCNRCASCLHSRSDMCATGLYKERGIHKSHGFMTEYIVDEEEYLVKVPPGVEDLAILTEPLSIGEKAISEIKHIQSRLPWSCEHPNHGYDTSAWAGCKRALVIGAGPLGFLTTGLLRLQGVDTYVGINRPEDNFKVRLVKELGAHYVDTRTPSRDAIIAETGPLDIIVEASGASAVALDLMPALARNGIYVLTGIPRGVAEFCLDGNFLLRQIVRYNQVIIGSVNSNRGHFEAALNDLGRLHEQYGAVIERVITHRYALPQYREAFENPDPDQIKIVFDLAA